MKTKMSVIEISDKKKSKRYSDLVRVPTSIKDKKNEIKYVVWEELGSVNRIKTYLNLTINNNNNRDVCFFIFRDRMAGVTKWPISN